MPRFEIIIYWSDEDQAFIAEVPEMPACMVDGNTYQEAIANAEVVMQEWIETAKELGRTVPEPKGRLHFGIRLNQQTARGAVERRQMSKLFSDNL